MKIFTGQSLRTLLNTPTAHSLLAPFGQCGWTDGGCAILADALLTFLPGSMPVLVVSENGAEHVAVRWDGLIWDADGASMDRVMIKLWRTVEHIPSAVLEDGSVETMALRGAPRDPSVSGKLVLMLAHRFCKDLDRWPSHSPRSEPATPTHLSTLASARAGTSHSASTATPPQLGRHQRVGPRGAR